MLTTKKTKSTKETEPQKWKPEKFGELLKALREENTDENSERWTAQTLAAKVEGLNATKLTNAERGDKIVIPPVQLMSLADALEMNTEERKEFCIAASWVENHQIASPKQDPEELLELVMDIIARLHAPGYVIDQYLDIIAANRALIKFFKLDEMTPPWSHWINNRTRINQMDIIFGHLAKHLSSNHPLESFITRTMKVFRIRSLRYRADPYYKNLITRLSNTHKDPSFRRFWENAKYLHEEDYFQGKPLFYKSPTPKPPPNESSISDQPPPYQFVIFTLPFLTRYGNLEVVSFIPTDDVTHRTFGELIEKYGKEAYPLTRWPSDKPT